MLSPINQPGCEVEILKIFILCHNRPDYARQAIASVLGQPARMFTLTVSDNSDNNAVEHLVKNEFPDVHYIRRAPILKAMEHFNRCIKDRKSKCDTKSLV